MSSSLPTFSIDLGEDDFELSDEEDDTMMEIKRSHRPSVSDEAFFHSSTPQEEPRFKSSSGKSASSSEPTQSRLVMERRYTPRPPTITPPPMELIQEVDDTDDAVYDDNQQEMVEEDVENMNTTPDISVLLDRIASLEGYVERLRIVARQQIITAGQNSQEIIKLKGTIRSLHGENLEFRNRIENYERKLELKNSYEQLEIDSYQYKHGYSPTRASSYSSKQDPSTPGGLTQEEKIEKLQKQMDRLNALLLTPKTASDRDTQGVNHFNGNYDCNDGKNDESPEAGKTTEEYLVPGDGNDDKFINKDQAVENDLPEEISKSGGLLEPVGGVIAIDPITQTAATTECFETTPQIMNDGDTESAWNAAITEDGALPKESDAHTTTSSSSKDKNLNASTSFTVESSPFQSPDVVWTPANYAMEKKELVKTSSYEGNLIADLTAEEETLEIRNQDVYNVEDVEDDDDESSISDVEVTRVINPYPEIDTVGNELTTGRSDDYIDQDGDTQHTFDVKETEYKSDISSSSQSLPDDTDHSTIADKKSNDRDSGETGLSRKASRKKGDGSSSKSVDSNRKRGKADGDSDSNAEEKPKLESTVLQKQEGRMEEIVTAPSAIEQPVKELSRPASSNHMNVQASSDQNSNAMDALTPFSSSAPVQRPQLFGNKKSSSFNADNAAENYEEKFDPKSNRSYWKHKVTGKVTWRIPGSNSDKSSKGKSKSEKDNTVTSSSPRTSID